MNHIKLTKEEFDRIQISNPNNDEFNSMITSLSNEKPINFKTSKKGSKVDLKKAFKFLSKEFQKILIQQKYEVNLNLFVMDLVQFNFVMVSRRDLRKMWLDFLQNNAAYTIFTSERIINWDKKLKYLDTLPSIFQQTLDKIDEVLEEPKKGAQKQKRVKKQNAQELYDEIFNS